MNNRASTLISLAALALAATVPTAAARPLDTARVTFTHQLGEVGLIDVYVDGVKVQRNVFPGTTSMFAFEAKTGAREVVVTPANVAPSSKVLFRSMVNVKDAPEYLLAFKTDKDNTGAFKLTLTPHHNH